MPQDPFADYYSEVNDLRSGLGLTPRTRPGTYRQPAGAAFGGTASPASGTSTAFNPSTVGADVAAYYQNVLPELPIYEPIMQNISGEIAPDVRNMLAQQAAERGVAIGSYGGGADQSGLLRALGLTSMELTNKGIGQYGEAFRSVPAVTPGELFITPTAQAQMNLQQQLQANQLASEATLQSERLRSAEQMQANQLAQEAYQFGVNRADTWSGVQSTNAALQGILNRVGAGGTGWGNESPYVGTAAGTSTSAGYTTAPYGTYGTPYTGPSSEGYMYSGTGEGYAPSWEYNPEYDIWQSDTGEYSLI